MNCNTNLMLSISSDRYTEFAKKLMSCNFGVYAMDWTGHGSSDGLHGYVPSLDHVVADVLHNRSRRWMVKVGRRSQRRDEGKACNVDKTCVLYSLYCSSLLNHDCWIC
ncbi:uncharacterized protein A4U43_C02F20560 [Asparagus officinalis]|uniref:Serine aminopeptidase S33 domain-containing protein n=1 Tax=Asparagus officinalis TaxID=4686 RepID=A0A5P1FJR6_ASPOF|nr:uncharacterized protein A4U43_C02F20560 [Asparagus officinalis]